MELKASVVISSYNCNEALPNTFYAISRQKTNFEFEVCYLDDCSYENPKFIYDYFLRVKHKKGVRLKYHIGEIIDSRRFPTYKLQNTFAMAFEMASADIIILNHGDVMMTSRDTIQKMVDRIEHKAIEIPDVRTVIVPQDFYINFEENVNKVFKNFKNCPLYQGVSRLTYAPTLMPFYKQDLYDLEYDKNSSEGHISALIKREKYKLKTSEDIIGIHQAHKPRPSIHFTQPGQSYCWFDGCLGKEYY